jgi:hypothetical protein
MPNKGVEMSTRVKGITWALFAIWAIFTAVFTAKFHSFVDHPLGHASGGGGGIFLVIGQVALAVAVIIIWQFGSRSNQPS